jgi:hypothetical protein
MTDSDDINSRFVNMQNSLFDVLLSIQWSEFRLFMFVLILRIFVRSYLKEK